MSSYLVWAFEVFFWELFGYRIRDDEMRWCGISLKHGTRFWSEMNFCWVYRNWNTIFIMERNDWSTNSNSHADGLYTFLFWTFGYRILYCRAKSASHAFQQWDDFLLGVLRLKHYFHYESYIDKPRPWWHWVRKDGTHFFAGHLDTQTESIVHPDRKGESSSRRTLISAPTLITPAKKIETVWGFVGLNISRLNIRRHLTLSDFHYQTHTTLNLKICNKTDLIVKKCLLLKNNWGNIWIIQIKVVTLHHQNNSNNN